MFEPFGNDVDSYVEHSNAKLEEIREESGEIGYEKIHDSIVVFSVSRLRGFKNYLHGYLKGEFVGNDENDRSGPVKVHIPSVDKTLEDLPLHRIYKLTLIKDVPLGSPVVVRDDVNGNVCFWDATLEANFPKSSSHRVEWTGKYVDYPDTAVVKNDLIYVKTPYYK